MPQPIEAVVSHVFYKPLAERLADRDKAVIEAILPTAIDNLPRLELSALDQQLETIFSQRYRNRSGATEVRLQFANAVSIGARRAYLNRPLLTERQAMRGTALASIDVVLGRQIARYARAVADKDQAAQVDILTELQNGLLVLSANQVEDFAIHLGEVLQAETEKLFTEIEQPEKRKAAMLGALNPALLVFDTIKHRGPNPLYEWLRQYQSYFGDVALTPNRLYLFDRIAGVMIGFDNAGNILDNLDQLLDPANIAWGDCALGQMTARGVRTGNFACGMGPQCRLAATGFGKMIPLKRIREGGYRKAKASRTDQISPYGISAAAMKDDCQASSGGAGGGSPSASGGGGGGGGTMAGVGGLSGCLVNAAFREAASSGGACRLNAMQKLHSARRNGHRAIGPAVRGVYGQGDCGTNPHMDGGFVDYGPPIPDDYYDQRNEQVVKDLGDRFANALADEDAGVWIRAVGDSVAGRHLSEVEWDSIAEAAGNAEICPVGCDTSYKGTTQCPGDKQSGLCDIHFIINIKPHLNTDGSCRESCQMDVLETFLHEAAAHASVMVNQSRKVANNHNEPYGDDRDSANAADEAREHERYSAARAGLAEGQGTANTAKSIADAISEGETQPGPGNRYKMCGPAAEALQDMMQCAAGAMAGVDGDGNPISMPNSEADLGSGLGNTDGNVDPSMEQWISDTYGDNVFARCTQQEGINVVGRDGNVYTIGGSGNGLSGQQCGALDCLPPARARSIGGLCRCVASGGGAAAVRAAIAENQRMRTCGVMTTNCDTNPGSPCCGGGAGVIPDIPGIDPGSVFDIDEVNGRDFMPIEGWIEFDAIDSNLPQPTGDNLNLPGSPP